MIKQWVTNLPWDIIKKISEKKRVNYLLIGAMVSVESNGDSKATRYEAGYRWLYETSKHARLNNITVKTEKNLQMSSMGLMQIMGANARVYGHKGQLSELYKPEIGLIYGIEHFAMLIDKYDKIKDAISAYNRGTPRKNQQGEYINQKYVDKVWGKYNYLKDMR